MTDCDRCNREPVYEQIFGLCLVCHNYLREQGELRQWHFQHTETDTEQETL
jgi:hypothetical protein